MAQAPRRVNSLRSARGLTSVKKAAYDKFQKALLDGHLRSGQVLSQKDLVQLLGISIGALRELLPRLEAESLLHVMPQRGIQITVIDLPMIRDAFQMRLAFEREAIIAAVDNMSDDILHAQKALHLDILERYKNSPSDEVMNEGQDIDTNFHDLFVTATENELLIQAYNVNSIRIRLINPARIRLSEVRLPLAFGDHLAVIDAVLERDKQKSIEAIEAHILNARFVAISF